MISEKLIHDHQNPLAKIDFTTKKLFLPSGTKEESDLFEKNLNNLKSVLNYNRVERRCARGKAIWLEDKNLAKILKSVNLVANYGFQNKSGKFLYPEEVLYLLETNRLELFLNETPVSIQEAYQFCLKDSKDFYKYRAFKKLALQGYKLFRSLKTEDVSKGKRKMLNTEAGPSKVPKISNKMSDIFEKLREKGPRTQEAESSSREPDYYVFLPNNSNRGSPDFRLSILDNDNFLDGFKGGGKDEIFAIPTDNSVAFYKLNLTQIPILEGEGD